MLWTYEISSGVRGARARSVAGAGARTCKVCARSRRGGVAYMHLHGGRAHMGAHVGRCRYARLGASPRSQGHTRGGVRGGRGVLRADLGRDKPKN